MPSDDEILRIAAQFDVGSITAGMDQAAASVAAGTAVMNDSFSNLAAAQIRVSQSSRDLRDTLNATASRGLAPTVSETEQVAKAMYEAKIASDAFKVAQDDAYGATQRMAGGVNNARIAFTGLTQDLGIRGSRALGSFISQSEGLSAVLSAAFPVVAAVALFEIVETGIDKLHKLATEGERNAEAWQKIDHSIAEAMHSADQDIAGLEVKLTELTQGKMEALHLQFRLINDDAIEMSSRMLLVFDQMGKQIDEEIGKFARLKEFTTQLFTGGMLSAAISVAMPTEGESIKAFGSKLSETLDKDGTLAGLHQVADEIRRVNAEIAKTPDAPGMKNYAADLEKIRNLLVGGLKKEALEALVNIAEQHKEAAAEAEKELAKELELFRAFERIAGIQERVAQGKAKLASDEELFGTKGDDTGAAAAIRSIAEVGAAEEKFRQDSMQRAREVTDFDIDEKIRQVQFEKALGEISNLNAASQINALISQRLAADERMLEQEMALIQSRLQIERASDAKAYAQDLAAYSSMLKQKQQLEQKASVEMEKIDDQANLKLVQSFKKAFDQITAGLNQSVVSWINGQESFGRAMGRVWIQFADTAVASILKVGEQQLVGLAVGKGIMDEQKLDDAKLAAANTYAAVSGVPVIGPVLAPEAAAAAFAAVLAFEKGGIMPNSESLALLHPREMVLPSNISESVQRMASTGGASGGGNNHFHVENHFHGNPSGSDISKMEKQMTAVIKRARRRGAF